MMTDVTRILDAIQAGEPNAAEELLPLISQELRKPAAQTLAHERPFRDRQRHLVERTAWSRLKSETSMAVGTSKASRMPYR